ncbi:hypothetical protein LX32DRAFT_367985 [Colletotrichum zoysiae]|uniref:Uncharacterized protein n=1 Tax=Colletotrichum zoysiae TaxID=1216348 RepID=A0AAD9HV93_9PEZI|nr:hypothetical protein LX32DRAFT_367985 [Colletotrichum zoysiae]
MSRLAPDPEVSKPSLTEPGEGGRRGHDDAVLRTMLGIQAAGPWWESPSRSGFVMTPATYAISFSSPRLGPAPRKKKTPPHSPSTTICKELRTIPPSPLEHLPRTGRLSPSTRRHDGQGFVTMSFPTLLLLAVTPAAWHRVSDGVDPSNIPEGVAGPHRGQLLPAVEGLNK